MTDEKRILTGDNGLVDITTEAILSGNGTCGTPCTKYPTTCTPTKVVADKCKKKECCDGM